MNNDNNAFLLKPSKSVDEFVAKQVYISEQLNQQPPVIQPRILLWCFLTSILTAGMLVGAIYLYSQLQSRRLTERVPAVVERVNPFLQIEKEEAAAAAATTPSPIPVPTPTPWNRDLTAEEFLDSPLSTETWVPFESKEFSFTAAFPSQPSVEPITGNWAVGKIFASTRDGDREGVIVFAMVYSAETLKNIKDGYSSRAFLELMLEAEAKTRFWNAVPGSMIKRWSQLKNYGECLHFTLKANAEPGLIHLHGKLIAFAGTVYQLLAISADNAATAAAALDKLEESFEIVRRAVRHDRQLRLLTSSFQSGNRRL